VGETLASQLDLKPGQGVLVIEVETGSAAQRAGVLKDDILLKLNGNLITEAGAFATELHRVLASGFTLEIVRHAKHETLQVNPRNG
jgi:serine protease Do